MPGSYATRVPAKGTADALAVIVTVRRGRDAWGRCTSRVVSGSTIARSAAEGRGRVCPVGTILCQRQCAQRSVVIVQPLEGLEVFGPNVHAVAAVGKVRPIGAVARGLACGRCANEASRGVGKRLAVEEEGGSEGDGASTKCCETGRGAYVGHHRESSRPMDLATTAGSCTWWRCSPCRSHDCSPCNTTSSHWTRASIANGQRWLSSCRGHCHPRGWNAQLWPRHQCYTCLRSATCSGGTAERRSGKPS